MSRATLTIAVEGSADVRRAFGVMADASRRAGTSVSGDAKKTAQAVHRSLDDETRARLSAAVAAERSAHKLEDVRQSLLQKSSRLLAQELALGVTKEEQAADRREAIYKRLATEYISQEHRKTIVAQREAEARAAAERRAGGAGSPSTGSGRGGRAGRGGGSVGGAVSAVGGAVGGAINALSDVQQARERYADIQDRLNHAIFNASPSNQEVAARRNQLLTFASANHMDAGEVAEAAATASERFSVFGDRTMTVQQREDRLRAFTGNLLEARNLGQDPTQYALLAGALSSSGMDQQTQTQTMRSIAGYGMAGAIDASNLTAEALRPLVGAIGRAMSGGPEAVRAAIEQQVTSMEILSPRGITALGGGNALQQATSLLGGERTQAGLLAHIRNRFGANSELEGRLFENGSLRGQYRNIYSLGEALTTAVGGDQDALRNLLGTETNHANGHILRQVFTQPAREALAQLAGTNGEGKTGFEQMRLLQESGRLGEDTVEQGRALFGGSLKAELADERNQQLFNLLNPTAMEAARQNQRFEGEHPWLNSLLGMLPSNSGDIIKGTYLGLGTGAERAADARPNQAPTIGRTDANGLPVRLDPQSIRDLAQVMRSMPPAIATIDPHTAAQAASQTSTRSGER